MFVLLACLTLSPLPSDTPPAPPVAAEQLDQLKSHADLIRSSRFDDGSAPPANLILPQLKNATEVFSYMRENYPLLLRNDSTFVMPWVWLFVDDAGRPKGMRLLRSSGRAPFDSLALKALETARFEPARLAGSAIGVWLPLPVQVAYQAVAKQAPRTGPEATDKPHFVPYTKPPQLRNRNDVSSALVRHYPAKLRDAGIGGTIQMWVFVDAGGTVQKAQIRVSSGYVELDQAAVAVARAMRFQPAEDGNGAVAVWISLPIVFRSNR